MQLGGHSQRLSLSTDVRPVLERVNRCKFVFDLKHRAGMLPLPSCGSVTVLLSLKQNLM